MKKTLVIGLDGVPCSLLKDYRERGHMPELDRILDRGHELHQMDASIPDVSSTSWSSFMTGTNPAEHGVYGFMDLKPNTYDLYFPNSETISAPTIWEMLSGSANGKTSKLAERYRDRLKVPYRSVVMNVPQTFPARPINGVLSAGFVCPDMEKGTYPSTTYEYLSSIGYVPDVDATKVVEDRDGFLEDVFSALRTREKAYEHLMSNEDWGLFVAVVTETDRLHHFFFDAAYDEDHPYHQTFVRFYRELDGFIGRLYDIFTAATGGDGRFITMSDHGFTAISDEVYVNTWLRKNGFLVLDTDRDFFNQIDRGTRAFAMDPARFYINTEGRYPNGEVPEPMKDEVAAELKEKLFALVSPDGRPVIREIHTNREIYEGPLAPLGPDLVCLANDGFDLKGTLKKDDVFGRSHFKGMHTSYDAHCITPEGTQVPERLKIEDLAPIILDNFCD